MGPASKTDALFIDTWEDSKHGVNYFRITLVGEEVELDYHCLFDADEDDWTNVSVRVPQDQFLEQLRAALATGGSHIEVPGATIQGSRAGMTREDNGAVRFDIHSGIDGAYHSVPRADVERMLAALEAA